MNTTLRLDENDAKLLDALAKFLAPDKLRGMPYVEVIRIAIRNEAARCGVGAKKRSPKP